MPSFERKEMVSRFWDKFDKIKGKDEKLRAETERLKIEEREQNAKALFQKVDRGGRNLYNQVASEGRQIMLPETPP